MIYVLRFNSENWPEYNRIIGVYSDKNLAIEARRRVIERYKKRAARSSHLVDEMYYHIEGFDIDSTDD